MSNYPTREQFNHFESLWSLIQNCGETDIPSVQSIIEKAKKKHKYDSEFSQSSMKLIHKALQVEIFGVVLPSKLFVW